MGKFVKIDTTDTVKYEALSEKPFNKVFALENILTFYKFKPIAPIRCNETFYDTPNDILFKAGVVLSKIQEDDRVFFKVSNAMSKNSVTTQTIFSHKVGTKDSLTDHAFYLVDGIRGIFLTPFNIDIENVIKNAVPKCSINIDANLFKVISGSGFRCYVSMEEITYQNYETKRTKRIEGMTVKLDSKQYTKEFNDFNACIKKHCKEFIEVHDNTYEHIRKITKKIDPKQAKEDMKKAKELYLNKKLED